MNTKMLSTLWLSTIHMGKIKHPSSLNLIISNYSDKIVTGSFDRTAKIWDANTG
jgi:dynein assembly factor with WDR repeat domains 1